MVKALRGFHKDLLLCRGRAETMEPAMFGPGQGRIWLDNVACTGNEQNITECSNVRWGDHTCDHSQDVGVICTGQREFMFYFRTRYQSLISIGTINLIKDF